MSVYCASDDYEMLVEMQVCLHVFVLCAIFQTGVELEGKKLK